MMNFIQLLLLCCYTVAIFVRTAAAEEHDVNLDDEFSVFLTNDSIEAAVNKQGMCAWLARWLSFFLERLTASERFSAATRQTSFVELLAQASDKFESSQTVRQRAVAYSLPVIRLWKFTRILQLFKEVFKPSHFILFFFPFVLTSFSCFLRHPRPRLLLFFSLSLFTACLTAVLKVSLSLSSTRLGVGTAKA
jgi:hypothetical protein